MSELPKRKELRIKEYDYSQNGYYFVTVCTDNRRCILSDIRRGVALLRPLGEIVETEIKNLQVRYGIEVEPYVIMPDHIHMLIKITRAEQSPAPTLQFEHKPSIGDIVCTFKSLTTKIANKNDNCMGRKIWQRNYFDHIIRNEDDYKKCSEYILNNPLNWELEKTENFYE